ncbi:MAG: chemotaxis-specific protein-glutamate methyltransferase CheB [Baekduia sp.]
MLSAPQTDTPVRVLVADDSSFMRRMLAQSLAKQGFEVVGEACDGDEAIVLFEDLRPDAMTLDLAMPGLDGIGVLKRMRAAHPGRNLPVIVVSAFSPAHGARAVDALAEGAFDLVAKPALGEPLELFVETLRDKVRAAAGAGSTVATPRPSLSPDAPAAPAGPRSLRPGVAPAGSRVLVIAISTGGPRALGELVPHLPSSLGAGGWIVQHMPPGFTASLAERLDRAGKIRIAEATGGESLTPGTLLIAPGGHHLRIGAGGETELSDEDPIGGLRPRADLTIEDAVKAFGARVVLVVMTGMGKDGLEGARAVKAAGGRVIAEAESSCTVYGMPRAVAEEGLVDVVAPLDQLGAVISREMN